MRSGLSIAFFGSSLVSAYWNGAATYYRGILRALATRGHRISFYEPDAYDRQKHRDIPDPPWARVVVYPADGEEGAYRALDEAADADVIVKASGVGAHDALLEAEVANLKRPGNIVVFWDVDAPATLQRLGENPNDTFHQAVPRYDFIFTYGGGDPVVRAYREFGARECVPIYNGLDPMTHFPVPPDRRFTADLALLANRLPDREARVEEFFFFPASRMPAQRFLLGGNGWNDKPMPPNVTHLGHVYTRDHNAFNCTPRAVLNISRDSMARNGWSPATRVFEAAGAGSCVITDEWAGIEHFFEPGKELLVARDGEEVASILLGLTPERATEIGRAAYRRAIAEHTYGKRIELVEKILGARVETAP
jgi:spore maturation protein CgeB